MSSSVLQPVFVEVLEAEVKQLKAMGASEPSPMRPCHGCNVKTRHSKPE